jgi:hypothetical protein
MIAQTGPTIPQIAASGGVLTMVYHQINADGAGPVACSVSEDATGSTFTPLKVTTDVPGTNGRSNAANADFPLVADLGTTTCTGTVGGLTNVCIVKCANPAGPFGGNIPVQQVGGAAATGAGAATGSNSTAGAATGVAASGGNTTAALNGTASATGNTTTTTTTKKTHKHKKGKKGGKAAGAATAAKGAKAAKGQKKSRAVEWTG